MTSGNNSLEELHVMLTGIASSYGDTTMGPKVGDIITQCGYTNCFAYYSIWIYVNMQDA